MRRAPESLRRLVAVDPSDGDEGGDAYGVAVGSKGRDGQYYQERSYAWNMTPRQMAESTVQLAEEVGADGIVVERNHGGKWMMEVFRQVDPYANIIEVWASDKKRTRAEPVAALFEKSKSGLLVPYRAHMVGTDEELEDELTLTNFANGEASPNRLDAMVWCATELMLGRRMAKHNEYTDTRLDGRR